ITDTVRPQSTINTCSALVTNASSFASSRFTCSNKSSEVSTARVLRGSENLLSDTCTAMAGKGRGKQIREHTIVTQLRKHMSGTSVTAFVSTIILMALSRYGMRPCTPGSARENRGPQLAIISNDVAEHGRSSSSRATALYTYCSTTSGTG